MCHISCLYRFGFNRESCVHWDPLVLWELFSNVSKASYVESRAGSRLSAFHALSQMQEVNSLEQTLGKGETGHLLSQGWQDSQLGIPEWAVEALILHSQKCLGKEKSRGEGYGPFWLDTRAAKFPNTPRRAPREIFIQPWCGLIQPCFTRQDRATRSLGNLQITN